MFKSLRHKIKNRFTKKNVSSSEETDIYQVLNETVDIDTLIDIFKLNIPTDATLLKDSVLYAYVYEVTDGDTIKVKTRVYVESLKYINI